MQKQSFAAEKSQITLYISAEETQPLIVLNHFTGDGSEVLSEMQKNGAKGCNLLVVSELDWKQDMTPWYCPPVFPKGEPYTGGADEYLSVLLEKILLQAKAMLGSEPSFTGIAGYSLSGLLALYALYRCDAFDCCASMSGSLWYPGFREYVSSHDFIRKPDALYFSLGDKEAKTKNQYMKTVQADTEAIVDHYKQQGLNVTWELNPGNHFRDAEKRIARGICALLQQQVTKGTVPFVTFGKK